MDIVEMPGTAKKVPLFRNLSSYYFPNFPL